MVIYCCPSITTFHLDSLKTKLQSQSGLQQIPSCDGTTEYCGKPTYYYCEGNTQLNIQVGISSTNCQQDFFKDLGCQVYIGTQNISSYCQDGCDNNKGQCPDTMHYIYCSGNVMDPACSFGEEVSVVCPNGSSACSAT